MSCSDGTVEAECLDLKTFLSAAIRERAALKAEFDLLTANSEHILQQMQQYGGEGEEEEEEDSEEEDPQEEGRLLAYQAEKQRLDEKLRDLEKKLKDKDEQMLELDAKASKYLLRVTTSSNSLFDQEESETSSHAEEVIEIDPGTEACANMNDTMVSPDPGAETVEKFNVSVQCTTESLKSNALPCSSNGTKESAAAIEGISSCDFIHNNANSQITMNDSNKDSTNVINSVNKKSASSKNNGNISPDHMQSLSVLVSELRRVKDDMGKCMSVKEKSFLQLEDELALSKKEQNAMKQHIAVLTSKINEKEQTMNTLSDENLKYKHKISQRASEIDSAKYDCVVAEKEELESKLKVLELMMTEYRAEIEAVTGEKTQVEEHAKELVKEITHRNEDQLYEKAMEASNDHLNDNISSSSEEEASQDISSADNLVDITDDHETMDDCSLLEEQNRKLSEKLRSTSKYLKALANDREHKQKECTVLQEKVQMVEGKMMQLQQTFDTLVSAVMVERDDLVKEGESKSSEINKLLQQIKRFLSREKELNEEINRKHVDEETLQNNMKANEKLKKSQDEEINKLKNEFEEKIIKLSVEKVEMENKAETAFSLLELSNQNHEMQLIKLKKDMEDLNLAKHEESTNVLKDLLKQKDGECKLLEKKVESVNSEMTEFVNCLKEEMERMKEDMSKQSEARLKVEVAYDTLTEDHRDLSLEKKRLEDTNTEQSIIVNDLKSLVESLKEQVNDMTSKNTSITCEFHEKEEEYNEELKAREATIQELRITLTNNQKQSSENYRALQEDNDVLKLKMAQQIDEAKLLTDDLEQKRSKLIDEMRSIEEQAAETLQKYEAAQNEFELTKNELITKINKLELGEVLHKNRMEPSPHNEIKSEHGKLHGKSEEISFEESQPDNQITLSSADSVAMSYSPVLLTAWSGTLEDLECELSLAKNDLVECGVKMLTMRSVLNIGEASDDKSFDNHTKIATMVRRVEELSGVLAATRLRRGLPVTSTITVTEEVPTVSCGENQHTGLQHSLLKSSNAVATEDKSTITWCPFKTQKEFEEFVAEKEKTIAELEQKVYELEQLLTFKSGVISQLQVELEGAKEEIGALKSSKTFKDHLDDINRLNSDIVRLKDELEESHIECDGLRGAIFQLESKNDESETVTLVEKLEKKLNDIFPPESVTEGETSSAESDELELKKNLDERLKYILSSVDNRLLHGSISQVDSVNVSKIAEIEKNYVDRINLIEEKYSKNTEELKTRLQSSHAHGESTEVQIKDLETQLKDLQTRLETLIKDKNKMDEKLKLTENKVGVLNEVKRKLVEYTKTLEEKIQTSERSSSASATEKNSIRRKTEELANENSQLKDSIILLNNKIDTMHIENSQYENKLKELEKEHIAILNQVQEITAERNALSVEHSTCRHNYDDLHGKLSLEEGKVKLFTTDLKDTESNLLSLKEENQYLMKSVGLLKKEKLAIESLKSELEENLFSRESESIANQFKCDELSQINTALQADIEILNSNIQDLKLEIEKLDVQIKSQEEIIIATKQEAVKAGVMHNQKLSNLSDLEEKLSEMQSSCSNCKVENEELKTNVKMLNSLIESKDIANKSLEQKISCIFVENDAKIKQYEEDQINIIEMQNMMVSDLEKMILSLEAEKNSLTEKVSSLSHDYQCSLNINSSLNEHLKASRVSATHLQEQVTALEQHRTSIDNELTELRLDGTHIAGADGNCSNADDITKQLRLEMKDLQQKLITAQQALNLKDSEYREKIEVEKGGLDLKLKSLRQDMAEEVDIIETRKDEETEELVEKFGDLEVEFTTKLAETKEFYETLLMEEKAEFGRVLVSKVAEYEKKLSEKCDEISGWEVKLISMQEELDGKMIVIEELEERLEESSIVGSSTNTLATNVENIKEINTDNLKTSLNIPASHSCPSATSVSGTSILPMSASHLKSRQLTPLPEESPTPSVGSNDQFNSSSSSQNPPSSSSSITSLLHLNQKVSTDFPALQEPCTLPSTFNKASGITCTNTDLRMQTFCPFSAFDGSYNISTVPNYVNSNTSVTSNFINPSYVEFPESRLIKPTYTYEPGAFPTWHPSYGERYDSSDYNSSPYDSNSSDSANNNTSNLFSDLDGQLPKSKFCTGTIACSRPILSLVIPSTLGDENSHMLPELETFELSIDNTTLSSSPLNFEIPKQPTSAAIRTAVFVSRDFPSDSTLHKTIVAKCSRLSEEEGDINKSDNAVFADRTKNESFTALMDTSVSSVSSLNATSPTSAFSPVTPSPPAASSTSNAQVPSIHPPSPSSVITL